MRRKIPKKKPESDEEVLTGRSGDDDDSAQVVGNTSQAIKSIQSFKPILQLEGKNIPDLCFEYNISKTDWFEFLEQML